MVAIQEGVVKLPAQIIVMSDIPPGAAGRIELINWPKDASHCSAASGNTGPFGVGKEIHQEHGKHIGDSAIKRCQTTIHVGLSDRHFRIEHQTP